MDQSPHPIWRYAAVAWLALIAIPTLIVTVEWFLGIGRDSDMRTVWELIFTFVTVLTLPMGALAYFILAPLAIGIERLTKGRVPRLANVALGALLALPAFIVMSLFGWAMDWQEIGVAALRASVEHALRHPTPLLTLFADFAIGGAIVGLGIRDREAVAL